MEMTPDDLLEATAVSHHALAPFIARDWSVQAGDLSWDVAEPSHTFATPLAGTPRTWQRRVRVGCASTSAHTPMLPMPNYSTS
jgi:hypothetical protein